MNRLSIKKWSILSLVLIAASAVTAAVLPSQKAKADAKNLDVAATCVFGADTVSCQTQAGGVGCMTSDDSAPDASNVGGFTSEAGCN